MAASPVTPAIAQGVVPQANQDKCLALNRAILQAPLRFYQFINWLLGTDGNFSDDARAQVWPPGAVILTATASAPTGRWLKCDGTSYSRTDYAALFSAIGVAFGSEDSTHFNVPDLRGRAPVGTGTLEDEEGNAGDSYSFAQKAGTEEVTLAAGQVPPPPIETGMEKFLINDSSSVGTANTLQAGGASSRQATPTEVFGEGDDVDPHDNVSPVLVMNYWIAY